MDLLPRLDLGCYVMKDMRVLFEGSRFANADELYSAQIQKLVGKIIHSIMVQNRTYECCGVRSTVLRR